MSGPIVVRRFLAVAGAVALLAVAVPHPANADVVEPIVIQANNTKVSHEYGPILGQESVTNQLGDVEPGNCELLPSCNLIHVEFAPPAGFNAENDTFLAQIVVDWEAVPVGDRNAGAASDDLDVYLWAAKWAETEPGQACHVPEPEPEGFEAPEYCDHVLAKSAGAEPPETVRLDATTHLEYLLVINHASGVNLGYTVEVESRYEAFVEPQGVPDTDFTAPSDLPTPAPSFGAMSSGGLGTELDPAAGVGAETQLALDPLAGGPDDELSALSGTGLPGSNFLRRPEEAAGPPKPVSGVTVALWLALVPVLAGGAAAYWFLRRRPTALGIHVPSPKAA